MKKVMFFTHLLVGGGAEKTVCNLSKYINENVKEYESYICVVYDDEPTRNEMKNVIVLKNKTIPTMKKFQKIPIIFKQAGELKKIKKELAIDICISFLPGADFLNALSKGKEKMIVSVRNKESFFYHTFLKKFYVKFNFGRSDKIIAISKGVEYDIVHNFNVNQDKVVTIYNPSISFEYGKEVLEDFKRLKKNKKIVINVGRLTEQKGQGYLIHAFSELVKKIPDAHLVILGQGKLEEKLKKLVKELKLEKSVTLLGFVRNPQDYIKSADLFVFSSIVEGLGNVLVETLRSETPIISTDCNCGPREILAPNTNWNATTNTIEFAEYGVLVPVCEGNWENRLELTSEELLLEEAMERLLTDSIIRENYRDRSRERLKSFEMEMIVKQWIENIQ